MGAAAVLHGHHVTVSRQLVGADPEQRAQGPGQRQEEAAVSAHPARGASHRRVRAVVTLQPPLGRVDAPQRAEQLPTAQPEFACDLVELGVTGRHVAGHQPRIVGGRSEQIARAEVARLDALVPRHPRRREKRGGSRNQDHLADRGVIGAGVCGDDDRPLPALVAGQHREEAMGRRGGVLEAGSEVLADYIVAAELRDRRARQVDRTRQHGADSQALAGVLDRFRNAVHRGQYCLTPREQSHTGGVWACPAGDRPTHGEQLTP